MAISPEMKGSTRYYDKDLQRESESMFTADSCLEWLKVEEEDNQAWYWKLYKYKTPDGLIYDGSVEILPFQLFFYIEQSDSSLTLVHIFKYFKYLESYHFWYHTNLKKTSGTHTHAIEMIMFCQMRLH